MVSIGACALATVLFSILEASGQIEAFWNWGKIAGKRPPKFNSEFAPEKRWLEDDPFLLGPGNFSGTFPVKLQGCIMSGLGLFEHVS